MSRTVTVQISEEQFQQLLRHIAGDHMGRMNVAVIKLTEVDGEEISRQEIDDEVTRQEVREEEDARIRESHNANAAEWTWDMLPALARAAEAANKGADRAAMTPADEGFAASLHERRNKIS
jgi:hypothetical protein